MLVLQNNVEIIAGAKKCCIYDLNKGRLYSLDAQDANILVDILTQGTASKENVPQEYVDYLCANEILVEKENLCPQIEIKIDPCEVEFAWLEITQNCNLICRHCYEGASRTERKPEMSLKDYRFAIDTLKQVGVDRIQLVGGEPLMHSRITQLIEYVKGKFSFIEIFTNGTLLTDELLELMKNSGVSLALSVYSEKPALHDYVTRVNGSYDKTYAHIKKALDKGIQVRIASVEMKGIPKPSIRCFDVPQRSDLPRLTGRASMALYNRDMLRRKLITKDTFKSPIFAEDYYRNKVVHNCFGNQFYIDYSLDVYPCAMERRMRYGNLRSGKISEIINNQWTKFTKDKIEGCKDCEYRYACFDCRSDANQAPVNAKPWYCTYNPFAGEWEDVETFMDALLPDGMNKNMEYISPED